MNRTLCNLNQKNWEKALLPSWCWAYHNYNDLLMKKWHKSLKIVCLVQTIGRQKGNLLLQKTKNQKLIMFFKDCIPLISYKISTLYTNSINDRYIYIFHKLHFFYIFKKKFGTTKRKVWTKNSWSLNVKNLPHSKKAGDLLTYGGIPPPIPGFFRVKES